MNPFIVTITGPSCGGKTTFETLLKSKGFASAISTTTRRMRTGETNGQSYYFRSKEEFAKADLNGDFVETVEFNGEFYGVTKAEIKRVTADGKKPVAIVVEPGGRAQINSHCIAHEWTIRKVYVGAKPEVLAARFLERFLQEFLVPSQEESALKSATSRLGLMLGQEQNWITEAERLHFTPYDFSVQNNGGMDALNALAWKLIEEFEFAQRT